SFSSREAIQATARIADAMMSCISDKAFLTGPEMECSNSWTYCSRGALVKPTSACSSQWRGFPGVPELPLSKACDQNWASPYQTKQACRNGRKARCVPVHGDTTRRVESLRSGSETHSSCTSCM